MSGTKKSSSRLGLVPQNPLQISDFNCVRNTWYLNEMIRFDRNDPFVPDFIKVTRVPVNDRPSALPETGYVNSYDFYSVYRTFPTLF